MSQEPTRGAIANRASDRIVQNRASGVAIGRESRVPQRNDGPTSAGWPGHDEARDGKKGRFTVEALSGRTGVARFRSTPKGELPGRERARASSTGVAGFVRR